MSVSAVGDSRRADGRDDGVSTPRDGVGPSPRPTRRTFNAEFKLTILAEYEAAEPGEKGAVLRREGLYSSHIQEWTIARDSGALHPNVEHRRVPMHARPKPTADAAELARLRLKNAKLEAQLLQTRTALDIMGKVHALLEQLSESADNPRPPKPRT